MGSRDQTKVRWALALGGLLIVVVRTVDLALELALVGIIGPPAWRNAGLFAINAALEVLGLALGLAVPVYVLKHGAADGRRLLVNVAAFLLLLAGGATSGQMKSVLKSGLPRAISRVDAGDGWSFLAFADIGVPVVFSLILMAVYLLGAALWWRPGTVREAGSRPEAPSASGERT